MRKVLFVAAGLLTALAFFLLLAPPKITFSAGGDDDVVVSCDAVSAIGDGTRRLEGANSRRYTFEVMAGKEYLEALEERHSQLEHVGPYDITDRIEDHCDRRRTGRVAGMVLSLAPAAVLVTVAIAFPSIRRDFWVLPPNRQ